MILKKSLTQIKNIKFDLIFFINLSFCMLPLAYILGNLLINLNSLILCCLGILYLKNKLFYFKPDFLFKIIILIQHQKTQVFQLLEKPVYLKGN